MGSFKEISKKRTKSHSDNQLQNADLFEDCPTAITDINELPHGKSRKLSHDDTSPSCSLNIFLPEDKSYSLLPSFNLNLDSASYPIGDCFSDSQSDDVEKTADKRLIVDSVSKMYDFAQNSISNKLLKNTSEKFYLNNIDRSLSETPGNCQENNCTDKSYNSYPISSSDTGVPNSELKSKSHFTELKGRNGPMSADKNQANNPKSSQPEQNIDLAKEPPFSRFPIDQSYETNTDLTEYSKCSKNPGHAAFHSVDELQVKNLPSEIQHEDSLTFFNCAAQLVVQISVFYTSPARGPNDMHSQYIGTRRKRNGSGFIASVDSEILKFRCKRNACPLECYSDHLQIKPPQFSRSISSPDDVGNKGQDRDRHYFYSGVNIHTNKHVIFDKSEAESAIVKFFFDSPDQTKVVYGHVTAIVGVNKSQDHVTLHVMSHDRNLFYNISCLLKDAKSSYNQMVISTHKSQKAHGLTHSQSWVAVIGHAHGLSKAITFGHVKKEEVNGERIVKYYDAATCPGSSGSLVMTPSLLKLQWPGAVHSASDVDTGLNVTLDSRVHDLDYQVIGQIYEKRLTRSNSDSSFPSIE